MDLEEIERYINLRIEVAGRAYFEELEHKPKRVKMVHWLRGQTMLLQDILRECFDYKNFEIEQITNSLREKQ